MTTTINAIATTTRDILKRAGNPFRNYFARNPDDDVCTRYHVPELFAAERDLLQAVIDLYRYDPMTHSEVVPILGNKGAGKTHLLHSIKHGSAGPWQLLVTPGVYQKDTDFLEYLLFQIVDTLLGGGKQKGQRPLDTIGEMLVRQQLVAALRNLTAEQKLELFPPPGFGKWARRLGLGNTQAQERSEWLAENLSGAATFGRLPLPMMQALNEAGLSPATAFDMIVTQSKVEETHNAAGMMRTQILAGFAKAVLLKDESELATFLTYGFAELPYQIRPNRADLVLSLFKVLSELFRSLKLPVVVAFDQLEDLLLARRSDDAHKIAETFFAGIVQAMHQVDGVLFLIFAERGLWNRFVPSLDGYIQDRLNNPVHVPRLGTVKTIRLESPAPALVRCVVEARLRPVLDELPNSESLSEIYPLTDEQITRIARSEPTLRDMLQQFRHLFDHLVYESAEFPEATAVEPTVPSEDAPQTLTNRISEMTSEFPEIMTPTDKLNRINSLLGKEPEEVISPPVTFRSVDVVEVPANPPPVPLELLPAPEAAVEVPLSDPFPRVGEYRATSPLVSPADLWDQEVRSARRRLDPDGALTGATRELQSALGSFLTTCHEQGVKVGPWRLKHVVPEWPFGEHPTYGAVTLAHWASGDGAPWRVAIGLFLARGPGKPKDLEVKLAVTDSQPQVVDHLILLRPDDDMLLNGKSKTLWTTAERQGKHIRLEPISAEGFAMLSAFPRWLAAIRESLPQGSPMPNLADIIQEKAERLLEQVCMPIQG